MLVFSILLVDWIGYIYIIIIETSAVWAAQDNQYGADGRSRGVHGTLEQTIIFYRNFAPPLVL